MCIDDLDHPLSAAEVLEQPDASAPAIAAPNDVVS